MRESERDRDIERERDRDIERERETETEKERDTDRQTQTHTHGQPDIQRHEIETYLIAREISVSTVCAKPPQMKTKPDDNRRKHEHDDQIPLETPVVYARGR